MITPEQKHWLWVLKQPCPQCGLVAGAIATTDVAPELRANGDTWNRLLAAGAIGPGRPDVATWSTLEYTVHTRDAIRTLTWRLERLLTDDDPEFPFWDQDAAADEDRYDEQDPAVVVEELIAAEELVAARLDRVTDDEWTRPGHRADGVAFTVASMARYLVHETVHHAWDVRRLG